MSLCGYCLFLLPVSCGSSFRFAYSIVLTHGVSSLSCIITSFWSKPLGTNDCLPSPPTLVPNSAWNVQQIEGTEKEWPAQLVVLAMGFVSPESAISKPLKLELDQVQQLVVLG